MPDRETRPPPAPRDDAAAPFVPDFVIVGAPKSGTTSLFAWLAGHPGICMSAVKEPLFWSPELAVPAAIADPAAYRALWSGCRPGQLTGEASVAYLVSTVAVPAIVAAAPATRLLVLLRNPADMAVSLHAMLARNGREPIADFEQAWRARATRAASTGHGGLLHDYAGNCAIGDQLERFLAATAPDRRCILLFDDLVADPGRVYRRVLAFLGLADDGRRRFAAENVGVSLRSARLARFRHLLPPALSRLAGRLNAPPPPVSPAFRAELVRAFAPQVDKVEALLGVALPGWRA